MGSQPPSDAASLLMSLPDELLLCILDHVRAAGLAASICVSLRLRGLSQLAANSRTQDAAPPAAHPCVLRALWADERLEGSVGRMTLPDALSRWRGEWPPLCAEQTRLAAGEELPTDGSYLPEELLPFATGALGAVEAQAVLGLFADSIGCRAQRADPEPDPILSLRLSLSLTLTRWAQRAGWSAEAATAYTMLFNHGRGALGKAVRQRSPRFTASTSLICRTLRAAALRQRNDPPSPVAYGNLYNAMSKARPAKVRPEWRRAGSTSATGCPGRHLGAASLGQ